MSWPTEKRYRFAREREEEEMGAISRKEDGTRVLTDSIRRDLEIRHSLTVAEAETLFGRIEAGEDENAAAEEIKAGRTVKVAATQEVTAEETNPLSVADKRRADKFTRSSNLPR